MKLIGKILLESFNLSEKALNEALEIQDEKGGLTGEILIRQKAIQKSDFLKALSMQYNIPYSKTLPLNDFNIEFTEKIPIQFLKKHKMVPRITPQKRSIIINNPLFFQALDDLCFVLDMENAEIVLSPYSAILSAINFAYGMSSDSAEQVIEDMHDEDADQLYSQFTEIEDLLDDTSDAPVIKLVNLMLSQAVKEGASDIHIEPAQNRLNIRNRVDGILYNMLSPPKHIQSALISRIKIMADLNIAEKRLPQDGRIEIKIANKNIDIRVSTLPTAFGERVVLRLLDKSNVLLSLSDIGMPEDRLKEFNHLITSAHGIILITGPTGSGKTTTLYGALSTINKTDINIITIEDPVEYQIEGIGQIQVNPKIGLTFARGLRSIVRQDPDVLLIGEIRDLETAEIAIQSALTGHLVFSTLHTNDSASAVTRLVDMGIEPFLITSSVIGIMAQRLVRVICNNCKEEYIPDNELLLNIGIIPEMAEGKKFYRGKGCPDCFNTGYKGRTGLFELMILDETLKNLILKTSDSNAIMHQAVKKGMIPLRRDGAQKVLDGITSIEEVFRVTQE